MMLVAWPVWQALRQRFDRGVLGVRVVARDFVERDGQDDSDQAGPGRPHVEPVRAEARPDRQSVAKVALIIRDELTELGLVGVVVRLRSSALILSNAVFC